MKNYLFLLLLFVINSGHAQSNHSVNLVAKFGKAELKASEFASPEMSSNLLGNSYTVGFEANKFLNQKRNLSIRYGILNQLNQYSRKTHDQVLTIKDLYDGTYETKINSYDILLPVKLQGHLGNWSIFGGLVPTYHFETKIKQTSVLVPQNLTENIEYESNFDLCNPLIHQCFSNRKLPYLQNFEFQYTFGIQYQIKRFSIFCEYSDYFKSKEIDPFNNPEFALIDVAFFPNFGSYRHSIAIGTAFRIY